MIERGKLVAARALIADPSQWTTHSLARDAQGLGRLATDEDAVCFCAAGALQRVCGGKLGNVEGTYLYFKLWNVLDDAAAALGYGSTVHANDDVGHAAVLQCYDYAIEHCGELV